MTRRAAAALAFLSASLVANAPGLTALDKISIRVSPTVSREPAIVSVVARIERDPANRTLHITAESADFYRSSTINLEGDLAPRVTEISFRSLPGGDYRISAVLVDNQGHKTIARSSMLVVSTTGDR